MKLSVQRKELLGALSLLQGAVERTTTLPVLTHVKMETTGQGLLLTGTDINVGLRLPLSCEVQEEGTLCVPARRLHDLVKELEGDSVEMEEKKAGRLRVRAGESDIELPLVPVNEFPAWPEMEDGARLRVDCAVLADMIDRTLYAAGTNDTRYTLNGLLCHLHGSTLTMVGTDGHRLAAVDRLMPEKPQLPGGQRKVIFSRKACQELRRLLGDEGQVEIVIGKSTALFTAGGAELSARLVEGTYPDYSGVIPKSSGSSISFDRAAAVRALRRVGVLAREAKGAMECEMASAELRFNFSQADVGKAREKVAGELSGDVIKAKFDAGLLLDALSAMNSANATVAMSDALSPCLITGDEGYSCVVMPKKG